MVETTTGDTWPQVRQELDRMHQGEFGGRRTRTQRTETAPQCELLRVLEIGDPPLVIDLQATRTCRGWAPASVSALHLFGLLPSCLLIGQFPPSR
jgi:hypothetical protein